MVARSCINIHYPPLRSNSTSLSFLILSGVDAQFLGQEGDDVGRKDADAGTVAQLVEFVAIGVAPVVERADRYACAVGQLLFGHCFH